MAEQRPIVKDDPAVPQDRGPLPRAALPVPAPDEGPEQARLALLAERFRDLDHYSHEIVLLFTAEGIILDANERAEQAYGRPRERLRGLHLRTIRAPATARTLAADLQATMAQGANLFRTRHLRADGTTFPVEVSTRVVTSSGIRYVQSIIRDLSEQEATERRLREGEERLQLALDASGAEAIDWDLTTGLLHVGPRFRALLGVEGDLRLAPGRVPPFVHAEDAPRVQGELDDVLSGRTAGLVSQHRVAGAGDRVLWIELHARVTERGDGGQPLRFVGALRDVTEQRNLQARMEVSDRLAGLGTLAAGVAHEINNPLAYVHANLTFLREELGAAGAPGPAPERLDELRQAADEAISGAARVREIVRGLRHFGRPRAAERRPQSVRREVEAAAQLARNEVSHRARLVLDLEDVPPVTAADHELGQVVLNLLVNAAHAIPEGHVADHEVRVLLRSPAADLVVLEVRDTGSGIPAAHLSRIFDPFFTTKPPGQGTGLGLSICHGIVSGLGGTIEVDSAPARGTAVRVALPTARRA